MKQTRIKIELPKEDVEILYNYLRGKRLDSAKEIIVLKSIMELLESELLDYD